MPNGKEEAEVSQRLSGCLVGLSLAITMPTSRTGVVISDDSVLSSVSLKIKMGEKPSRQAALFAKRSVCR